MCSICGAAHEGLPFSWGFDAPVYWNGLDEERGAEGYCDTDLCSFRDDSGEWAHFVRGTIEIPVIDGAPPDEDWFAIGVWASLSASNFNWLVEHWDAGPDEQGKSWFGWLSSVIPIYPDTLNLKTNVILRGESLRPRIEVQPSDHPLAQDQWNGIALERAQALAARWMHVADASE